MFFLAGATHQTPQATLSQLRQYEQVIYRQVEDGETWTLAPGRHVALHYVHAHGLNDLSARKIAAVLDRCVIADCRALALDLPSSPIPVYFYPSVQDLDKAIAINQKFVGGMSLGNWAVIFPSPTVEQLEADGAHALGQALVHAQLGLYGCPLFAEGIAYYLQARYHASPWLAKPAPVELVSLPFLADAAKTPLDFLQGARFIGYLIKTDHGDTKKIKDLLTALNKARIDQIRGIGKGTWLTRVNAAFQSIYNKPLATLESDWRKAYPG
jgi:hypothetical protein